jgi:tol-pal system protein YbgF
MADLGARLDALEGELDRLNGRVEESEHRTREALEEARSARREAAQGNATPPAPVPAGANSSGSEADSVELDAYRHARAAWSDGDADACIDRFLNFLQTHPSSTYAENASYWMADCYFKRGDFKTAVLRFDDVVARYPDGARAPDALYRQGESLLRLGPQYGKAAGKAFERVVQEYPNSERATKAREQLKLLRSG